MLTGGSLVAVSQVSPGIERGRPAYKGATMGTSASSSGLKTEAGQVGAQQLTTQQRWDEYVAAQLSSRKDGAGQAELISTLEAQLAQPGECCMALPYENCGHGV